MHLNEKNEIIIESVIPKPSAYSTNKINSGHIIQVSFDGNNYSVSCSSLKNRRNFYF